MDRSEIHELADKIGAPVEDVLMASARRDPLNKGTAADHAKAEWFADLWRDAVEQREADQIHIRGLHYVLVQREDDIEPPTNCSWDRYRGARICFDYLKSAGTLARVLGYIPLSGIIDEKNDQQKVTRYERHRTNPPTHDLLSGSDYPRGVSRPEVPALDDRAKLEFDDVEAFIDEVAEAAAESLAGELEIDRPTLQPFHVEMWSEKTLPREVKREARDAGVNVIVEGDGHLSYTVAHDLAQRVERAGKPAVVFYMADFDPAGDAMPGAMASKMAWLDQSDQVDQQVVIQRLAVTAEQVDEHDLPREPVDVDPAADAYATLAAEWQTERGGGAVELNALEADLGLYREIVREGVGQSIDNEMDRKISLAVDDWRDDVADEIASRLRGADLDATASDLEEWAEDFNEELEAVADDLAELRDLADAEAYREWNRTLRQQVRRVDLPDVDLPDGEADLPDGPIYDSGRDYLENVRQVKQS